jgi:hypothetical protein
MNALSKYTAKMTLVIKKRSGMMTLKEKGAPLKIRTEFQLVI